MAHHTRLSRVFSLLVLFVLVFTSFGTIHAQDGGPGDPTATPAAPPAEGTPTATAAPDEEITVVPAAQPQPAAVIFSISGKVTGKDGKGLAGVEISDDQNHQALTGEDGSYALGGLKAGTYIVRAKLEGVELIPFYRVVKLVDKDVSGVDFYPPKNTIQARTIPGAQMPPAHPAGNAPAVPSQPGEGELGAQAVYKVDQPGTVYRYVDEFGTAGEPYNMQPVDSITYLNEPSGIAIDGDGKLLVVEEVGNRLVRFDASGASDLAIGQTGVSYTDNYAFND